MLSWSIFDRYSTQYSFPANICFPCNHPRNNCELNGIGNILLYFIEIRVTGKKKLLVKLKLELTTLIRYSFKVFGPQIFKRIILDISGVQKETTLTISDSIVTGSPVRNSESGFP